jgi:hypothetical protein
MMKACYIVGGGKSLDTFDFSYLDGKDVIAINQSLFHVPNAKYFVTMDYTWVVRNGICGDKKCKHPRHKEFVQHPAEKVFVLSFGGNRLQVIDDRHFVDQQYGISYDLTLFDRVVKAYTYGGMGRTWENFRCGSDSGYAGLQLAVVLGYTEIYLLGYDFRSSVSGTHFHADYAARNPKVYDQKLQEFLIPYPMALDILRNEFGVTVYSCSERSRLNRYIPFKSIGD